jgi:autotransporter-associated beta strand protein
MPTASSTIRSLLYGAGGTSAWNGPITINGDGQASPDDQIAFAGGGGFLIVGGNVTGVNFPGTLQLRGDGSSGGGIGGVVSGTLLLGANATLQVNDGVLWTISSTGNTWGLTQIAHGTLQLGINNALPTGTTVQFGAAGNSVLDLNGFNQQVAALTISGSTDFITNSSATANSTLTYNGTGPSTFSGTIADNFAGGGGQLALTVAGNTLILSGANTYSGNTTISGGTLALSGSGTIGNSTNLIIGGGATLDVSGLSSPLTLGSSQTLTGSGATGTINSNLNMGTGSMALNYTNGTPTLTETNGALTFNNNAVTVTVAGSALPPGNYQLISTGTGGSVAGSVNAVPTVNGAGVAFGQHVSLSISGGGLYLVVTNHPPVANPSSYSRLPGFTLKIAIAGDLATNWSDADGDPVALTGAISSTNGASVSYDTNLVYYYDTNNVADQINYTVSDGHGGTAAGIINVVLSSGGTATTMNITGEVVNGDGSVTLSFAGIPGFSYSVQATTNLVVGPWQTIGSGAAATNGVWQFTDTNAASYPSRYYRTSYP